MITTHWTANEPYEWIIKTEAERAWFAGIIDGEGCITIKCHDWKFTPLMVVSMCDSGPIDKICRMFHPTRKDFVSMSIPKAANRRLVYRWQVEGLRAVGLIGEIYPYLTCKRTQALIAWSFYFYRVSAKEHCSDQEIRWLGYRCYEMIRNTNARCEVGLPSWMREPQKAHNWYTGRFAKDVRYAA